MKILSFWVCIIFGSLSAFLLAQSSALSEANQENRSTDSACFYTEQDGETIDLSTLCDDSPDQLQAEVEAEIDLAINDFMEWQKQELISEGMVVPDDYDDPNSSYLWP